jgi:hypothetical protein
VSVRGIGVAVIARQCGVRRPLREQQALAHAKAVLLVDHHQREVAIGDAS